MKQKETDKALTNICNSSKKFNSFYFLLRFGPELNSKDILVSRYKHQ